MSSVGPGWAVLRVVSSLELKQMLKIIKKSSYSFLSLFTLSANNKMDNYSNDPYWSFSFKRLELADETVKVVEEWRVVAAGRQKRCPESSQRVM